MRPFIPLILALLAFPFFSSARKKTPDSLQHLVRTDKNDRDRMNHLILISKYYIRATEVDSAIRYGEMALQLSHTTGIKTAACDLYGDLGIAYADKGNYPKALDYYLKGLKLAEYLQDDKRIADSHVRLGTLHDENDDYDKALKNYHTGLAIYEKLQNKARISLVTGNIGNVYLARNQFDKALQYYLKALKIDEELNNRANIKYTLGYVAMAYTNMAKKQTKKRSDSLNRIAYTFYDRALKTAKEDQDIYLVINWMANMGVLFADIKNYEAAEKHLLRALELADSLDLPAEKIQFENAISEMYYAKGDYKKSIDHYKKYTREKDSMFNAEKHKELTRHEMNYEFDKKMALVKSEQEKKEAAAGARNKQQKLIIVSVITGLVITFVAFLIILRSLKTTRRQKEIIEKQKHMVDEKQKEIIDSINYARRIQQSLLTTESYIHRSLYKLKKK